MSRLAVSLIDDAPGLRRNSHGSLFYYWKNIAHAALSRGLDAEAVKDYVFENCTDTATAGELCDAYSDWRKS
jgi:hypothetical protein